MRKLICVCVVSFLSFVSFAQDDDTFSPSKLEDIARNMKTVWNDADADFAVSAIPDKWKEESGVIIAQKTRFSFDKDANKLAVYEITRRRIKLNDRDAVNSYSSVYFRIGSVNDGAGIKIIKANGMVLDVSLRNAIYVEDNSDVPSTFQPYIGKVKPNSIKAKARSSFIRSLFPTWIPVISLTMELFFMMTTR
jgi:hypothetical protein